MIQLLREFVAWGKPAVEGSSAYEADEVFDVRLDRRTEIWRTVGFFSWFIGGATALWLLGIVMGLPLLIFFYILIEGKEKWKVSLIMSAVIFLLVWGLFEYLLEIRWPPGALFR